MSSTTSRAFMACDTPVMQVGAPAAAWQALARATQLSPSEPADVQGRSQAFLKAQIVYLPDILFRLYANAFLIRRVQQQMQTRGTWPPVKTCR